MLSLATAIACAVVAKSSTYPEFSRAPELVEGQSLQVQRLNVSADWRARCRAADANARPTVSLPQTVMQPAWRCLGDRAPAPAAILTASNEGFLHWLRAAASNLQILGLADAVTVCTLDSATSAEVGRLRLRRLKMHSHVSSKATKFGSGTYIAVVHSKATCIVNFMQHATLPSGCGLQSEPRLLHFFDLDTTFVANPLCFPPRSGTDIEFLDDCGPKYRTVWNSGFWLMWVNVATRRLWKSVLEYHQQHPNVMDQPALSKVMQWEHKKKNYTEAYPLRKDRLESKHFVNGFRFYQAFRCMKSRSQCRPPLGESKYRRGMPPQQVDDVVAVHHNWCPDNKIKWKRATEYDALANVLDEQYSTFTERLRKGMREHPVFLNRGVVAKYEDYKHCKPWGGY